MEDAEDMEEEEESMEDVRDEATVEPVLVSSR